MHCWITPGGQTISARTFPQLIMKYYWGKITGKSKTNDLGNDHKKLDELSFNSPLWIGSTVYPINKRKLDS